MRRVLVALLALAVVQGPAGALGPLDDDAGSGADAGDFPGLELPIAPGTHRGSLATPHDIWDRYSFQGHEGMVARITFQSEGYAVAGIEDMATAFSGESREVVLTATGTWNLTIGTLFVVLDPRVAIIPYHFTLELLPARSGDAWRQVHGRSLGFEAAFPRGGNTDLVAQARIPLRPDEPMSAMFAIEWSSEDEPHGGKITIFSTWVHGGVPGGGMGHEVIVSPGAVHVPLVAVRTEEEIAIMTVGLVEAPLHWVRIGVHATVDATLRTTLRSAAPFPVASTTDLDAFVWDERNSGAAVQVLAPGASLTAPRELSLELDGGSVVFMDTSNWWGTITDPSGDETPLGPLDPFAFVMFPEEEGTWKFSLGWTAGGGLNAVHRYLVKLQVPHLGIAP